MKKFYDLNKLTNIGKVNVLCGGRSSQQTYNQMLMIYERMKELTFKEIEIRFIEPDLLKLEEQNKEIQDRIKKALEYIDRRDIEWASDEHDKLIEILKGGKE